VIKLLVVDDSPLMRRLLGELFEAEGDFEVVFARNGVEALERLQAERPDVITLDVNMPEMDGLQCLDRIMIERPTPVVIASSITVAGADEALRAIELGAVDVIAKPSGAVSLKMGAFGPPLVQKVRAAASARLPKARRLRDRVRMRSAAPLRAQAPSRRASLTSPPADMPGGVVVVGASTGGPPALDALLGPLPADFPWPIVIAQHMPAAFTRSLAQRLNGLSALTVVEVDQPTLLRPGHAYVAKGDADMIVSRRTGDLYAMSAPASPDHRWHPSVDRLMQSVLSAAPAERVVGVLMTGMGSDGAESMSRLKEAGGHTIAEAEETAVVWGMPRVLIESGGASVVAPVEDIAACLLQRLATG
jgi:two-component system chemotaxis response regulator CheB